VHGDFLGEYYKNQWFKIKLAKFVLNKADKIRVVGERIKKSLKNLNIVKNKIEIRPIVVDAEKIKNYQAKFNLHKKYIGYGKIFLVLGRLDSVKNISWLIDIFTEVIKQKNYLLLIVGDGLEQKNLQFKVKKYNLDNNIKFEFWTNDPISYLKTADCVLFPSLSEGYGLVPMEANATGIPVIINDVGVANYELKPSERVKILKINNKEAWIKAILEV
jgi:glycosyltransferase involved in cell wall biosynthesis